MADDDYRRLSGLCGCGTVLPAEKRRGRPRKYCEPCRPLNCQPKGESVKCRCGARLVTGADGVKPAICKKCRPKPPPEPKPPKFEQRECPACRGFFLPKRHAQQHCSKDCWYQEYRLIRNPVLQHRPCACCGKDFQPDSSVALYCSSACKQRAWRRNTGYKPPPPPAPAVSKWFTGHCRECSQPYGSKTATGGFCGFACYKAQARRKSAEYTAAKHKAAGRVTTCEDCQSSFCWVYGSNGVHKVCPPCSLERKRAAHRAAKAFRSAMERAKNGGERFDPLSILARDKWKCQLCGRKTPKEKRGTYDDDAPELDHIVPLALGGMHTRANTQCACRACNSAKGARPVGQLLLIG